MITLSKGVYGYYPNFRTHILNFVNLLQELPCGFDYQITVRLQKTLSAMENQHSMGDQFLANVNRIIDENLTNENFSVEDLAQQAGLSRSMLHRKV